MKLYATTTSERASKGQGGNDFLEIELFAGDRHRPIGHIYLDLHKDTEQGYEVDEWVLQWKQIDQTDGDIIAQGHIKGEKKKGDNKQFQYHERARYIDCKGAGTDYCDVCGYTNR